MLFKPRRVTVRMSPCSVPVVCLRRLCRWTTRFRSQKLPFTSQYRGKDKLAAVPPPALERLSIYCWILFEQRLHLRSTTTCFTGLRTEKSCRRAPKEASPLVGGEKCTAFVMKTGALLLARKAVTVRPVKNPALKWTTLPGLPSGPGSKLVSDFVRTYTRQRRRRGESVPTVAVKRSRLEFSSSRGHRHPGRTLRRTESGCRSGKVSSICGSLSSSRIDFASTDTSPVCPLGEHHENRMPSLGSNRSAMVTQWRMMSMSACSQRTHRAC